MRCIQAVIDTNVLVAAMRSTRGASFKLIDDFMAGQNAWEWNISNACVLEYEEVLLREGLPAPVVAAFLADLLTKGIRIRIPKSFRPIARDPDDDVFAELALTLNADYLVTFNIRDLISVRSFGISVVTPSEFLKLLETGI